MAQCIDIKRDRQNGLHAACAELARGNAIGLPTETVYGLAADATNPDAILRIYETKGRPRFNPLICHMADLAMAEDYAVFDPLSHQIAQAFWPGPLTLIVPLKQPSRIHSLATAGLDTVGIRVPQGFAGELIQAFGKPLAAPSANTSGKISPTNAAHVETDLGNKIPLILDGGTCDVGLESTIVKVDHGVPYLLRPGGLAAQDIERVAGQPLARAKAASPAIEAPGMLASHYAPDARVRLAATSVAPHEVLITFGDQTIPGMNDAMAQFNLSPAGDLAKAASCLFDYMKQADAKGASCIAFAPIPQHGLGEAINDRLQRAAAPRP